MSFYQGEYRNVSQLDQSMFGPECISANCAKNCCATKPLPAGCPGREKKEETKESYLPLRGASEGYPSGLLPKERYIPLSYWPIIDIASGGRLTHCAKEMYPFNQMIFIKK